MEATSTATGGCWQGAVVGVWVTADQGTSGWDVERLELNDQPQEFLLQLFPKVVGFVELEVNSSALYADLSSFFSTYPSHPLCCFCMNKPHFSWDKAGF